MRLGEILFMFLAALEFLKSIGYIGIIVAGLAEAIFMPFPMDIIFIPLAAANPNKAINYVVTLITFSSIGSIISYKIGKVGGRKLLYKINITKRNFSKIERLYNDKAFITIMTSAFTPIPYEIYTITAGIFNVDFKKYITASVLSRIIRYSPQGILIFLYGDEVLLLIERYGVLSAVMLFIVILMIRYIYQKVVNYS